MEDEEDILTVLSRAEFSDRFAQASSPLGAGAYGAVFAGFDLIDCYEVAIKRVLVGDAVETDDQLADTALELILLGQLNHPCLARYVLAAQTSRYPKHEIILVMERANGVEMKIDGAHTQRMFFRVAAQLWGTLAYMHKHGFAHRDVKPNNVMLTDADDEDRISLKLVDFGFLCTVNAKAEEARACACSGGTRGFIPPEILTCPTAAPASVWLGADVFAGARTLSIWATGLADREKRVRSALARMAAMPRPRAKELFAESITERSSFQSTLDLMG